MRIGDMTFDPSAGALTDPSGATTELRPRTADILALLLRRRGETVSKDEILDAVWSDLTVSEDSLYQGIAELRRALGSEGKSPLQTVPRKGYRLAPARYESRKPDRRRTVLVSLLFLVCLGIAWLAAAKFQPVEAPSGPSIAVLPFESTNEGTRWSLIGRGLAIDIAGTLSRNARIETIAPATVAKTEGPPASVAEQLDVRYVVSGTIQPEGDEVRISVALTDHATNKIVWTLRSTRPTTEISSIQDEIIDRIDGALSSAFGGLITRNDLVEIQRQKPDSLDAYESFLLGMEEKHKFTPDGYDQAVEHLSRAVRLDPGYAAAWATLSLVRSFQSDLVSSEDSAMMRRLEGVAIERAFASDPNDPDVLWRLANYTAEVKGDRTRARALQREAIARAPNNADVLLIAGWQSPGLGFSGEEPYSWTSRAMELNPDPPVWYRIGHGVAAYVSGEYQAAVEILSTAPPQIFTPVFTAFAQNRLGNETAAREAIARAFEIAPDLTLARMIGPHQLDVPELEGLVADARAVGLPMTDELIAERDG